MSRLKRSCWAGAVMCAAWPAAAHDAGAAGRTPDGPEGWVIVCMALSALLYVAGWVRLRAHAVRSRRHLAWCAAFFVLGWLALALALLSPLDAMGARSFSMHMLQHELLMVVAAPLLVVAAPLGVWAWALPRRWRATTGGLLRRRAWRVLWRWLCRPSVAWALHALALWGWHVPTLFEAALRDDGWHTAQHVSFLATALLYWWSVLGRRTRAARGAALASLFTTMLHTGALGALLTVSPALWYPIYASAAPRAEWTPIEDQQLGGLLMWIPAGLVYVGVALSLALRCAGFIDDEARARGQLRRTSSELGASMSARS